MGTSGGALGGIDGGTLWRLPLSAVAQYRPDLDGKFDPYVGLGFVYNVMIFDDSSAYKELFSEAKFSNEIDLVAQVGVNYSLDYPLVGQSRSALYGAQDHRDLRRHGRHPG